MLTGVKQTNGFWQGVKLTNTNSAENVFAHTTIAYGGSSQGPGGVDPANLMFDGHDRALSNPVKVRLDEVALQHSGNAGLYIERDVTLDSCSLIFKGNQGSDIAVNRRNPSTIQSKCAN